MSTFAKTERDSGEGKGQTAEVSEETRTLDAGPPENIRRTVTFRGALSF